MEIMVAQERREIVLAADTVRQEVARTSQAERDRTLAVLDSRKLQAAASEGKRYRGRQEAIIGDSTDDDPEMEVP